MPFLLLESGNKYKIFSNVKKNYSYPITLEKISEIIYLYTNNATDCELQDFLSMKYYLKITTSISDKFYVNIELLKISTIINIKLLKLMNYFIYNFTDKLPIIIIINEIFHFYKLNNKIINMNLGIFKPNVDNYEPFTSIEIFVRNLYNGETKNQKNKMIYINEEAFNLL
jgi:hypothetical protein